MKKEQEAKDAGVIVFFFFFFFFQELKMQGFACIFCLRVQTGKCPYHVHFPFLKPRE